MTFPLTAEDFYNLRDDRNNRCTGNKRSYQLVGCTVTIDPPLLHTLTGQTMLLAVCNLLSRWCRRSTIVMSDTSVLADPRLGSGKLAPLILDQMRDADPFGDFTVTESAEQSGFLKLHLGPDYRPDLGPATVINASGWLAAIATSKGVKLHPEEEGVNVGALCASCLGVAQLFKKAVDVTEGLLIRDGIFDMFRLKRFRIDADTPQGPGIGKPDVGRLLMVGAGSVGSATAYCLSTVGASCNITVIDKDLVKVENFNRSPVFGRSNVGWNKAKAVAGFLEGSRIKAYPFEGWWDDFINVSGRKPNAFDIWLPLANENGVRRSMQENYPPLMIHGTTAFSWGVNHARHIPGTDDCIVDRFPQEVPEEVLACSTGKIAAPEMGVDAALPFLSLFAGILVTADLLRSQISGYPQVPNFAFVDFGGQLEEIQVWNRIPRPNCSCKSISKAIYLSLNGSTKFAHLAFGVI